MLTLLVYLLVFLLIASVVWWVIGQLALPQPVRMVAAVIMAIVAVIFLLEMVGGLPHLALR